MFQHILVAYDGSDCAKKALAIAAELARLAGAHLSLVSVEEHIPRFPGDIGEVKEEKERQNELYSGLQNEAAELVKYYGVALHRADILVGHVARSIIDHARGIGCDLIVMGHSGRSGAWIGFLGTTADKVSRHAHCTVMIAR